MAIELMSSWDKQRKPVDDIDNNYNLDYYSCYTTKAVTFLPKERCNTSFIWEMETSIKHVTDSTPPPQSNILPCMTLNYHTFPTSFYTFSLLTDFAKDLIKSKLIWVSYCVMLFIYFCVWRRSCGLVFLCYLVLPS